MLQLSLTWFLALLRTGDRPRRQSMGAIRVSRRTGSLDPSQPLHERSTLGDWCPRPPSPRVGFDPEALTVAQRSGRNRSPLHSPAPPAKRVPQVQANHRHPIAVYTVRPDYLFIFYKRGRGDLLNYFCEKALEYFKTLKDEFCITNVL